MPNFYNWTQSEVQGQAACFRILGAGLENAAEAGSSSPPSLPAGLVLGWFLQPAFGGSASRWKHPTERRDRGGTGRGWAPGQRWGSAGSRDLGRPWSHLWTRC